MERRFPELDLLLEAHPDDGYLRYHMPRYRSLFATLEDHHRAGCRVLDVGSSLFTEAVRARFGPVDTLGLQFDKQRDVGDHYHFNLNDCRFEDRWRRDMPQYDVIIFAEVLEHLYTAPSQVLRFLNILVKPGGLLLLQTPNAAALNKRLKLLTGRNPYELLREEALNPGHYREYTLAELRQYLLQAGYDPLRLSYEDYFDFRYMRQETPETLETSGLGRFYNIVRPVRSSRGEHGRAMLDP